MPWQLEVKKLAKLPADGYECCIMKIMRGVLWVFLAVLITSCAHLIPPVPATYTPDGKTTVLYARLDLENEVSMGNRLALWLMNDDLDKSVYLYFDEHKPTYAVLVEPGKYRLVGFAGIDMTHRILGRQVFKRKTSNKSFYLPFEARTNSAIYIGDFTGYAKVNFLKEEWAVKSITNNFTETTAIFHVEYPNLSNITVISAFEH